MTSSVVLTIETTQAGIVLVSIAKTSVSGPSALHRMTLDPDADVAVYLERLHGMLQGEGYAPLAGDAADAITAAVAQARTPEVLTAWHARLDAERLAEEERAAAYVPASISDRQFAQQLAIDGVITETEALAWAARGDLPAALEAALVALPQADRFAARMLLSSATTYERSHPLVPVLGDLLEYSPAELDDLWRAAAAL